MLRGITTLTAIIYGVTLRTCLRQILPPLRPQPPSQGKWNCKRVSAEFQHPRAKIILLWAHAHAGPSAGSTAKWTDAKRGLVSRGARSVGNTGGWSRGVRRKCEQIYCVTVLGVREGYKWKVSERWSKKRCAWACSAVAAERKTPESPWEKWNQPGTRSDRAEPTVNTRLPASPTRRQGAACPRKCWFVQSSACRASLIWSEISLNLLFAVQNTLSLPLSRFDCEDVFVFRVEI